MSDEKKKGPGLGAIAASAFLAVVASGTSPWWWEKFFGNNNQPAQVAQQPSLPQVSSPPDLSTSSVPTVSASIASAPSPSVTTSSTPSPSASAPNTPNAAVEIKWSDSPASLDIKTSKGLKFAFACPPSEQPINQLWGTAAYTDNSSVCLAGVHSGVITKERGGVVNIEVRGGQPNFIGSQRFGVLSKGETNISYFYSFVVLGANVQGKKS
jgi:LCCL domain